MKTVLKRLFRITDVQKYVQEILREPTKKQNIFFGKEDTVHHQPFTRFFSFGIRLKIFPERKPDGNTYIPSGLIEWTVFNKVSDRLYPLH